MERNNSHRTASNAFLGAFKKDKEHIKTTPWMTVAGEMKQENYLTEVKNVPLAGTF